MGVIDQIREMHEQGHSQRRIAETLRVDRKTVKRMLEREDFGEQIPKRQERGSGMDEYGEEIRGWLAEDTRTWRKQRHTAQRIWDRLREKYGERFTLSYSTVQRYVKRLREERVKAAGRLELTWYPGEAQVDFGQADALVGGIIKRLHYLVVSFPYSNAGYLQWFRGENAECVVQGLVDIFAYIGGVPSALVFDNATGVGRKQGEALRYSDLFLRFKNHYRLKVRFCNPYSGHEKGNVEAKVGYLRRNLLVPIPEIGDLTSENQIFLGRCEELFNRQHYKHGGTTEARHQQDKVCLMALPRVRFSPHRVVSRKADGYGKICLEGNHYYSAGPEQAHKQVHVEIGAHELRLYCTSGKLLCTHIRQYGAERTDSTNVEQILATLCRSPGAYKNSALRQNLPSGLQEYFDSLSREQLKEGLRSLNNIRDRYDYATAIEAAEEAVKRGAGLQEEALLLAVRIAQNGIGGTCNSGPDLEMYDRELLKVGVEHDG
jgi:Transposase and inactivated derivatives